MPDLVRSALTLFDDTAFLLLEPDGRIARASGAVAAVLGLAPKQCVGQIWQQVLAVANPAAMQAALDAVLAAGPGGAAYLTDALNPQDGHAHRVRLTLKNGSSSPAVAGVVVRVRRVEAEDERALRAHMWEREIGFWEWHPATDHLVWLNGWWRGLDIEPCDGEGHVHQVRAILHPADWPKIKTAYEAHASGAAERYEVEYRLRTRGGVWHWVAMIGRIVERAPDGSPRRMLGAAFDIEQRKQLEASLRRQHLEFEIAANNVPTWIIMVDLEQRIEFCNKPFRGLSPEACRGRLVADLVEPAEADRFSFYCRAAIAERAPQQYRTVIAAGNRVLETRLSPLITDGEPVGVISVVMDATSRIELERAVLEIADDERRRFGADIHDGLGQELTGIALTLKTLVKQAEGAGSPLAGGLHEALDLANMAIRTCRQLARGLSPVAPEQGGLRQALQQMVGRLEHAAPPEVSSHIGVDVPEYMDPIVADHLYRIAQEAVSNAIRHADARHIRLALTAPSSGTELTLAIIDDGCGAVTDAELGPGLGLKIMRYRAEVLGGMLTVGPGEGGGTRVEVTCPLANGQRAALNGTASPKTAGGAP